MEVRALDRKFLDIVYVYIYICIYMYIYLYIYTYCALESLLVSLECLWPPLGCLGLLLGVFFGALFLFWVTSSCSGKISWIFNEVWRSMPGKSAQTVALAHNQARMTPSKKSSDFGEVVHAPYYCQPPFTRAWARMT